MSGPQRFAAAATRASCASAGVGGASVTGRGEGGAFFTFFFFGLAAMPLRFSAKASACASRHAATSQRDRIARCSHKGVSRAQGLSRCPRRRVGARLEPRTREAVVIRRVSKSLSVSQRRKEPPALRATAAALSLIDRARMALRCGTGIATDGSLVHAGDAARFLVGAGASEPDPLAFAAGLVAFEQRLGADARGCARTATFLKLARTAVAPWEYLELRMELVRTGAAPK